MAGLAKRLWILIIASTAIASLAPVQAAARQGEPLPPIHYDIGIDTSQNDVEAFTVRATLRAGTDGVLEFDAPKQPPAEVHAERGTLDTSKKGVWRVTTSPNGDVALAWRSAKPEALREYLSNAWDVATSSPGAAAVFGNVLLAIPHGGDERPVTATIAAPSGWTISTAIGSGTDTAARLPSTSILAARNPHAITRQVWEGTTLRVTSVGANARVIDGAATTIAHALGRLGKPAHAPGEYLVNVITFDGNVGWGSGATPNTALVMTPANGTSSPWVFYVLRSFTASIDTRGTPEHTWFTMGVTAYRYITAMADDGTLDNVAVAQVLDQATSAYGDSSLRRAPNARVASDYESLRDLRDMVTARGELFAVLVDHQLREATRGRKRLIDLLQRLDGQTGDPGPALIAAVKAEGGGDITPLYQRYILDGELLQLPRDALGPCFTIGTVAAPDGWQIQHVFAKHDPACRTVAPPIAALPCPNRAAPVCCWLPS